MDSEAWCRVALRHGWVEVTITTDLARSLAALATGRSTPAAQEEQP